MTDEPQQSNLNLNARIEHHIPCCDWIMIVIVILLIKWLFF